MKERETKSPEFVCVFVDARVPVPVPLPPCTCVCVCVADPHNLIH